MIRPAMAVHGGAWAIPPEEVRAHREGCVRALGVGLEVLDSGGPSLEAVEAAVVVLENDETFDAGRGSFMNEAGEVTLDAGIMEGRSLGCGSVADVRGVRNPIALARRVLESSHAILVGEGARAFAVEHGVATCDPEDLVCPRERRRWEANRRLDNSAWAAELFGDTVGAVALDREWNLAAATSTGGSPMKPVGRVGDSPFVGAGLFADNRSAAVSATGHGELIIPLVWSKSAADLVLDGAPAPEAAARAVDILGTTGARGGLVIVDNTGRAGVAWNTPAMAFAMRDPDTGEIVSGPSGRREARIGRSR